jgi:DNA-binding transcriptional regulator YiaG
MKRMECTKCKQVFWPDLKIDEALIRSGEWFQTPCPRCEAEWAIVEPGRIPGWARRKPAKPPTRRPQARPPAAEAKAPVFPPARILSLRRRLGLSQKELGSLIGVSRGPVLGWEKGKYKPREEKAAQLAALARKGKEEVKKLLGEKMGAAEAKPNPRRAKRRKGVSQRAARPPKK